MIYIVAGGRDFADKRRMERVLSQMIGPADRIMSGCAPGADTLAIEYADERLGERKVLKRPADWDKYGKSAGFRRNHQMALEADVLIAFWDGRSKGTKNMIEEAHKAGLEIHIYRY